MTLTQIRTKNLTTSKTSKTKAKTKTNGTYTPEVITDKMVENLLKPILNLDELLKDI